LNIDCFWAQREFFFFFFFFFLTRMWVTHLLRPRINLVECLYNLVGRTRGFKKKVNCGDHCLRITYVLIHRTGWKASKDIYFVIKAISTKWLMGINSEYVILWEDITYEMSLVLLCNCIQNIGSY
jgi:hypothetical protein